MGLHTAYDNIGSASRVDMISDMLSGMNIADLTVIRDVIDSEIQQRRNAVLERRKRNLSHHSRRHKKRSRPAHKFKDVSNNALNAVDDWVFDSEEDEE